MKKIFCWNITKDTFLGLFLGFVMIGLSLLMIPFMGERTIDKILSAFFRDFCMVFGLGFVFVTSFCKVNGKEVWKDLGFTQHKLKLSLFLNLVFALGLLFIFMKDGTPVISFSLENVYGATYILVAGCFEMLFIYGFLRMTFEKSFGVIPAILLTSVFYSLHHAGFQPEFFHLFFVGIMYTCVFYITHNMLIVFPFFWAVGALWDVLVDSPAGDSLRNPFSFSVAIGVIVLSIIWYFIARKLEKLHAFKNRDSNTGASAI